MSLNLTIVLALYFLTCTYQSHRAADAAPYDNNEGNAIIVIPFKASDKQVTKMNSFKIDGPTAVKQLTSRVSVEKILRTLSNVPEFDILVEGLDAVTLGDVYKAVFPSGILQSISEQYLRSPLSNAIDNSKAETVDSTKTTANDENVDAEIATEIPYDEVHEDDPKNNDEDLKQEPHTDVYLYDQPDEDRFIGEREIATRENDDGSEKEIDNEDVRDSKNLIVEKNPSKVAVDEKMSNKEVEKYGAQFRNWITNVLTG